LQGEDATAPATAALQREVATAGPPASAPLAALEGSALATAPATASLSGATAAAPATALQPGATTVEAAVAVGELFVQQPSSSSGQHQRQHQQGSPLGGENNGASGSGLASTSAGPSVQQQTALQLYNHPCLGMLSDLLLSKVE
jgi:hypothetical protein